MDTVGRRLALTTTVQPPKGNIHVENMRFDLTKSKLERIAYKKLVA